MSVRRFDDEMSLAPARGGQLTSVPTANPLVSRGLAEIAQGKQSCPAEQGLLCLISGDLDGAIRFFDEALRINPNNSFVHNRCAVIWFQKSRTSSDHQAFDKAIKHLDESLRIEPMWSGYHDRGCAWYANKCDDKAIADFDEAIRIFSIDDGTVPDDEDVDGLNESIRHGTAEVYYSRGMASSRKKVYDKAIQDFDEAIRRDATKSASFVSRGEAWWAEGDADNAIKDFDETLRLDQTSEFAVSARLGRGRAWAAKGYYKKALTDYDEAVRLDPGNVRAWFLRGSARSRTRCYAAAIKDFEEAVRLEPNFVAACDSLAWLLATCHEVWLRDGPRAVALATKACELTGWKSAEELSILAAAHAECGDFDLAASHESQALEIDNALDQEYRREWLEAYQQKRPARQKSADGTLSVPSRLEIEVPGLLSARLIVRGPSIDLAETPGVVEITRQTLAEAQRQGLMASEAFLETLRSEKMPEDILESYARRIVAQAEANSQELDHDPEDYTYLFQCKCGDAEAAHRALRAVLPQCVVEGDLEDDK